MEKVLKYLEGDNMYLTRKISLQVSNYHSVKYLMELFLSTTEYQEYPIGYEVLFRYIYEDNWPQKKAHFTKT